MKTNKSFLLLAFTLLWICNNAHSQTESMYFITLENDSVNMHENTSGNSWSVGDYAVSGDYALAEQFLYYHDSNGELIKIKQTDVKNLYVENHYYDSRFIKGNKGQKRLHEVLITSDNFSVTLYFTGTFYLLYIWDKNGDLIEGKITVSRRLKDDQKTYDNLLKDLLKDCPEIKEQIEINLSSKWYNKKGWGANQRNNMFDNIQNIRCNN